MAGSFVKKYSMATVLCKRIIYGKILNDSAVGGGGARVQKTVFEG